MFVNHPTLASAEEKSLLKTAQNAIKKATFARLQRDLNSLERAHKKTPLQSAVLLDTVHWNPWLRHLVNRPAVFVQCDSVSVPSLHDFLVAKSIDSRPNPAATEIAKNPLGPNTVVLRPRPAASPGEGPVASPEQFLVDSWVENQAFSLADVRELRAAAEEWISKERVHLSSLLCYAMARNIRREGWLPGLSIIAK